ncbi:hypothetical protein CEXT_535051 [Caerostris extrusa]|uniref:Uncharacterized protein n=1 Tax=Caerostris extrusa TaxID=172846 RepID=A0AAV4P786_CAEEX|nr:hypothetical protein CEXT_535051 [Caerostris extrusa]
MRQSHRLTTASDIVNHQVTVDNNAHLTNSCQTTEAPYITQLHAAVAPTDPGILHREPPVFWRLSTTDDHFTNSCQTVHSIN